MLWYTWVYYAWSPESVSFTFKTLYSALAVETGSRNKVAVRCVWKSITMSQKQLSQSVCNYSSFFLQKPPLCWFTPFPVTETRVNSAVNGHCLLFGQIRRDSCRLLCKSRRHSGWRNWRVLFALLFVKALARSSWARSSVYFSANWRNWQANDFCAGKVCTFAYLSAVGQRTKAVTSGVFLDVTVNSSPK